MQCVLKDKFRLYPNSEDDYDVALYENQLVFEPCVKGKGLARYRSRTEVNLDDVIGCHVMRVADRAAELKKSVSYFCVYAYHLVQKKKSNYQRRQKKTYVFAVDKGSDYEANLAISRIWQSAFLWLLRGVVPQQGDGKSTSRAGQFYFRGPPFFSASRQRETIPAVEAELDGCDPCRARLLCEFDTYHFFFFFPFYSGPS
ncbi:hypothetical protein HPB48_002337 [Haemaphysalis longicornis]|uniref:Uncharacterized protein n=1 Tax=Haemaphysalis longicornis TaxID=44386 RepID=A0A9J6FQS7_HAELO|nr:hypothetical protein HPB48_002337 [Haemaphysalis longicornis]